MKLSEKTICIYKTKIGEKLNRKMILFRSMKIEMSDDMKKIFLMRN
jgi:hypothetical protein